MEVAMVDDKFLDQALVFIDDLEFSEISREIGSVIENIIEGMDLYEAFCKQHARIIADEIESNDESVLGDLVPSGSHVPSVSVRITETANSFRAEWQRNVPILGRSGRVKSFQRLVIKLADG